MTSQSAVALSWPVIRDVLIDLVRTPSAAIQRWGLIQKHQHVLAYIGWAGRNNLGDEVMFDVIGKALQPHPFLNLFPEPGERFLLQIGCGGPALFRAACVGGGTLINPLHLPLAKLLKAQHLPLFTIGTGVGNPGFGISHEDDTSLHEWAKILADSRFVSVRGPRSKELLRQVGVTHAEVIGDPALGITPDSAPAFRSRQRLIINLSEDDPQRRNTTYQEFLKAVESLAREFLANGGEVVGVALGQGDSLALKTLRLQPGLAAICLEDHRSSGERFLRTVSGSHAVISVRLHAAVLASCVGVPSLLFAYRSKCQDFMSSMDVDWLTIPITENITASAVQDRFYRMLAHSSLGLALYSRAFSWKTTQKDFYNRLLNELSQSGN